MRKLLILGAIAYLPLTMTQAHANPPLFIDDGGQYYDYGVSASGYRYDGGGQVYDYGQRYDDGGQYYGYTGLVPGTYGRTPVSLSRKASAKADTVKKERVRYDYGSVYDRFIAASFENDHDRQTRGESDTRELKARVATLARLAESQRAERELAEVEEHVDFDAPVGISIGNDSDSSGVDSRFTDRGTYHEPGSTTVSINDVTNPDYNQYY